MGKEKKHDDKIIIELDNIRARTINDENKGETNHFYLNKYYKEIQKHINIRISELHSGKVDKKEFFDYRMHDSILIYGTRGNGKTTIMINLQKSIEEKFKGEDNRVKVLDIIDPTVLEPTEDFLLIILSTIMNTVEKHHRDNYSSTHEHKREKFYNDLEEILKKIESTHMTSYTEVFDKFYGDKTAVGLAKALHDFFYNVTKIFDVDVLVLPIDDIDMNMQQGYSIAETIRKYLSSPYIIPVVSFNIKQMRAIAKYNKYKAFGIDLTDKELENHKDLDFLYSIPTDYLASIFPPDRRIVLKSIFDILKEYNQKTREENNIQFHLSYFGEKKVSINNIISLISNIIFENHMNHNIDSILISDYLTHRSIRDFLKDCHSIMYAIADRIEDDKENNKKKKKEEEKKNKYNLNYKIIRNRFSPDDKGVFVKQQQALIYLWDEFISLAKKNLSKKNDNFITDNNWAKIITEILYNDQTDEVNKKIYRRLWLQNYYLKQDNVTVNNLFKKNTTISKSYNLAGALELAMRSYIPMYLFETIIKNSDIKYSNFDLISLKELAEKDLIDVAYFLSTFEIILKRKHHKSDPSKYKVFGSVVVSSKKDELYKAEYNIPYLFKLEKQDQLFDDEKYISHQIYFMSMFKAIALFIEINKIEQEFTLNDIIKQKKAKDLNEEENEVIKQTKELKYNKLRSLAEEYRCNLPCLNNPNFIDNYFDKKYSENLFQTIGKMTNIDLDQSTFGILEIINLSKKIVDYFFEVRANTNIDHTFSEVNLNKNIWLYESDSSKRKIDICMPIKKANHKMPLYDNSDNFIKYSKNNKEDEKIFDIKRFEKIKLQDEMKHFPEMYEDIGTLSPYFTYPLSAYLTSFSQALLLTLIKSNHSEKDNNSDFYTRNSFHGANLTILKEENNDIKLSRKSSYLFQNIHVLIKKNKKRDKESNQYKTLEFFL